MKQKLVEERTQFFANITQRATSAYRLPKGRGIAFQLAEFPVKGTKLFTAQPVADVRVRRVA